jgi:hypothetical protein
VLLHDPGGYLTISRLPGVVPRSLKSEDTEPLWLDTWSSSEQKRTFESGGNKTEYQLLAMALSMYPRSSLDSSCIHTSAFLIG